MISPALKWKENYNCYRLVVLVLKNLILILLKIILKKIISVIFALPKANRHIHRVMHNVNIEIL